MCVVCRERERGEEGSLELVTVRRLQKPLGLRPHFNRALLPFDRALLTFVTVRRLQKPLGLRPAQ